MNTKASRFSHSKWEQQQASVQSLSVQRKEHEYSHVSRKVYGTIILLWKKKYSTAPRNTRNIHLYIHGEGKEGDAEEWICILSLNI